MKGIGVWTAQMYLIFSAGRLDVFPHDDLGVRMAIKELYRLPRAPRTKRRAIASQHPGGRMPRVASWYCWRYLGSEEGSRGGGQSNYYSAVTNGVHAP